jgi:hypothetical protein
MSKNKRWENVIQQEDAQKQVDLLIEYYDLDPEKEELRKIIPDLTRHIMRGRVEITEDAEGEIHVRQNFRKPVNDTTGLNYNVINGVNKTQMKTDTKSDFAKIYAMVGSMTGWSGMKISQLKGVDNQVVETLGALFLA